MRRLMLLFSALLLTIPSFSQVKHPFTFEDMLKLKRVGAPQVSPHGKWVLFSVVDVDLGKNTKTPHVWVVSISGGQEREIIMDQDADSPRWAPDGKRFAFLSTKEDGSQIWIADFDDASGSVTGVHKLTALATEVAGEIWSPDGTNIAFTSDVYPECDGAPAQEQDCNTKKVKEAAESKVKALIFDRLLYRHWNAYKEGKRTHIFVVPDVLASARSLGPGAPAGAGIAPPPPRDLTPGDYDAPPFTLGGQDLYAFSPDGKELCYTSNHDKMEAASTNNDLWIVPVNGGAAKNITADNPASDSTPLYSPDGKYIAYRAQQRAGYESDRFRLMLYDRKTGEKRDLTEDFDHWVGSFAWAPDSKTIYFAAEHMSHSLLYAVQIVAENATGENRFSMRALVGGYNDDPVVTNDGKTLLFSRMSITAPTEIYASEATGDGCPARTGDVDRGKENCSLNKDRPVTHMNDAVLAQVNMQKYESFSFKGAKEDDVEGLMVRPPNFDPSKKYPVKFLIHGGPQGDWGGAPFEDLMKGLDYAEQHYPFIDKDRECALGASYGGYAINWILGHTNRFKCLVSHDGMFNTESAWGTTEELWFNEWEFKGTPYTNRELYRKWSPHLAATNFKTPTLVVHSQHDYRLDVSEGFQLFTTLQRLNVPSKMLYFPDEGHWVLKPQNSQLWYKTVNDWVDQWTKK